MFRTARSVHGGRNHIAKRRTLLRASKNYVSKKIKKSYPLQGTQHIPRCESITQEGKSGFRKMGVMIYKPLHNTLLSTDATFMKPHAGKTK